MTIVEADSALIKAEIITAESILTACVTEIIAAESILVACVT
jgi:hypothetical protein